MPVRKYLLLIFLIVLGTAGKAQVSESELTYKYLGPGAAPNTAKYEVAVYFTANLSSKKFPEHNPGNVYFCFFNEINVIPQGLIVTDRVRADSSVNLEYTPADKCVDYREPRQFQTNRYRVIIDLPIAPKDYIVTIYNEASRSTTLVMNVDQTRSLGVLMLTAKIPGTDKMGIGNFNSTPPFVYPVEYTACNETTLISDFAEKDPDGDILKYSIAIPESYDKTIPFPLPPPYPTIHYLNEYDPDQNSTPLGPNVKLNENTGTMIGVAPKDFGYYLVAVTVKEYRNNILIDERIREKMVYVNRCRKVSAMLKDQYTECTSYTYNFRNEFVSTGPASYSWDFGVPNMTNDTSSLATPTFTYPDTGTYKLTLIVYDGECRDTATSLVKVYPGFKVGFIPKIACASLPVEFRDTSSTLYGNITGWQWDFGDGLVVNDTSNLQNPSFKYNGASIYKVTQIVTNSLGCLDTAVTSIAVPPKMRIDVTPGDTTICGLDAIQLHVTNGIGAISWTPVYNIDDPTSDSPMVSPDTKTLYKVSVVAGPGCSAEDSILVDVVNTVQVQVFSDRDICVGDTVHLSAKTDHANVFNWSPVGSIQDGAGTAEIVAKPASTATYHLDASFGSCTGSAEAVVTVYPYPVVQTFGDTAFCYGKTATIGVRGNADSYTWSPATYLTDPTAMTHVVTPEQSVYYTVEGRNLTGCTKPVSRTVSIRLVYVVSAFAGNDTNVVKGQPLVLNASGGTGYEWTPAIGLSSPFVNNPTATPDATTMYKVRVSNDAGCIGYDSVKVNVYYTGYDILAPTAFTPNRDGRNDEFKVVAPGMTELKSFIIYNRWGQMVFSTKNISKGWDGNLGGQPLPSGVYVWFISGKFLDGKVTEKKGTMVLVR